MPVELVKHGLTAGLAIWFVLLLTLVAGRILNGTIEAQGMLSTTRHAGVEPERVLTMLAGPAIIVIYLLDALHTNVTTNTPKLPELNQNLLMLLTGGNGIYLAGKAARTK